jgi:hypothetical protein
MGSPNAGALRVSKFIDRKTPSGDNTRARSSIPTAT